MLTYNYGNQPSYSVCYVMFRPLRLVCLIDLFLLIPHPIKAEKHNNWIHIKEAKLNQETGSLSLCFWCLVYLIYNRKWGELAHLLKAEVSGEGKLISQSKGSACSSRLVICAGEQKAAFLQEVSLKEAMRPKEAQRTLELTYIYAVCDLPLSKPLSVSLELLTTWHDLPSISPKIAVNFLRRE